MRYKWDSDLHIHSKVSLCSNDPEQTNERILQYAKEHGLQTICLTDHFWDQSVSGATRWYATQDLSHIKTALPLPQEDGIRFWFGCETEMDQFMNIAIAPEHMEEFDFIVIPTTHFHITGCTIAKDCVTPQQKADFWLKKLNALLDKELPFEKIGLAHLTCPLIDSDRAAYLEMLSLLPDQKLKEVFTRVKEKGAGVELNAADMNFREEEADIYCVHTELRKIADVSFIWEVMHIIQKNWNVQQHFLKEQ